MQHQEVFYETHWLGFLGDFSFVFFCLLTRFEVGGALGQTSIQSIVNYKILDQILAPIQTTSPFLINTNKDSQESDLQNVITLPQFPQVPYLFTLASGQFQVCLHTHTQNTHSKCTTMSLSL